MKKKLTFLISAMFVIATFVSCNNGEEDQYQYTGDATVSVTSVLLNETAYVLTVGENFTLTATVLPENATNRSVTWTSSNNNVATVSNGIVTAVSAGTATVIAITQDGNHTATCEITVNPVLIPVTAVTLNHATASLGIGNNLALIATILPGNATNRNLTWTSSNSAVATVNSSGVVTAVSAGTTTITVTTQDGGHTATCVINVSDFGQTVGRNCNNNLPGWGNSLGTVSFASNQTWSVGHQIWSDAVIATACASRTAFNGGNWHARDFNADCRNSAGNANFSGHYFSWCAVMRFANQLCPYPWRVPTRDDFETLHFYLGQPHNASGSFMGTTASPNGGTWGGARFTGDASNIHSTWSAYWSSTEQSTGEARSLQFTESILSRAGIWYKDYGFAVRCVR